MGCCRILSLSKPGIKPPGRPDESPVRLDAARLLDVKTPAPRINGARLAPSRPKPAKDRFQCDTQPRNLSSPSQPANRRSAAFTQKLDTIPSSKHLRRMSSILFSAENAAEFGRRGGLAAAKTKAERKQQERLEAEAAAKMPVIADESARTKRVMRQIERCDDLMDECDDGELFVKLTAAKERLWNLIFPKAGTFKPKPGGTRRPQPVVVSPAADNPST